jgi:regulatory protein
MENEIKILSVEKKKDKYRVTTNENEFVFDEDTIIKHLVFKDKIFTKDEFTLILDDLAINTAFNKALRYLNYGLRTIYEMKTYLKEFTNIDKVIEKLQDLGYLNDKAYAKNYLDYCKRNNKGPIFYKNKLLEKKIDKTIINHYLEEYSYNSQLDIIMNIINKEINKLTAYPFKSQQRMLISKLIRNGFSNEIIYETVNKLELVDESDDSLKRDFEKQTLKLKSKDITDSEKKQRIIAHLLNKGYEYRKIIEIIE